MSGFTPGKISFFTDQQTASGVPASQPGLAVYDQSTLGGWWLVQMPNGKQAVLQQTDIGPAPWTGRKYDFTIGALPALGYTSGNFPTDATANASYLGKSVPSQYRSLVIATGGNATSSTPPSSSSSSTAGSAAPAAAASSATGCLVALMALVLLPWMCKAARA